LDRYRTYLGNYPARDIDLRWLERLDVDQLRLHSQKRREAAPAAIIWLVTLACNRRCPYCFYEVTPHSADNPTSPADATFSLDNAIQMVTEMAAIGAGDLYLTGGEPLLRQDLPEIIHFATSQRVRTHLVTKYPISRKLAETLASAGLGEITYSLDDARPKEAGMLAGSVNYLEEAKASLANIVEVGIPLDVNAVVTRLNMENVEALVKLAIALRVPTLTLNHYSLPLDPRPSALRLVTPELNLNGKLRTLQDQYGQQIELRLGSGSIPGVSSEPCGQHAVCDVGFRDLHMLPDGRVTRCRYLPDHDELIVGSLQDYSIMKIWNGPALADFSSPPPVAYEETSCHGCTSFDACNSRGRCYVTALTHSGRLHAPDAFCGREA